MAQKVIVKTAFPKLSDSEALGIAGAVIKVSGLTPGTLYAIQVRALGGCPGRSRCRKFSASSHEPALLAL